MTHVSASSFEVGGHVAWKADLSGDGDWHYVEIVDITRGPPERSYLRGMGIPEVGYLITKSLPDGTPTRYERIDLFHKAFRPLIVPVL